jgi:hypothetical protein
VRRLLLAALLLLAACKKTEPPPPAAPPPPALPALPELKPSEDFAKDGLLELPAEGPAEFGWNLAENAQHMYGYEQESHMILAVTGNKEEGKLTFRTLWKGAVKIAGGGTRGDVFFISTPTAHWVNGAAVTSEELQKITRTLAEYQLTSAGQFPSRRIGQGDEDPKLDLYFAIPSRPLKEGESETKPVHLQEPNVGSQYHGNQVIVHAGRRKVGRHECVKLLSKLDLDVIPPGKEDNVQGRLIGAVAAYYDPKERIVIRVEASFAMAVDVRYEVKPADPTLKPFWALNRTQADSRITIKLDGS